MTLIFEKTAFKILLDMKMQLITTNLISQPMKQNKYGYMTNLKTHLDVHKQLRFLGPTKEFVQEENLAFFQESNCCIIG